jgi:hypothetical protein
MLIEVSSGGISSTQVSCRWYPSLGYMMDVNNVVLSAQIVGIIVIHVLEPSWMGA